MQKKACCYAGMLSIIVLLGPTEGGRTKRSPVSSSVPGGCALGVHRRSVCNAIWHSHLRLRGGSVQHDEEASDIAEDPLEFPHIPTDELSEDELETLRQFQDVERQYHENTMPVEARQEFEKWMEMQAVALKHGASNSLLAHVGVSACARVLFCDVDV